jgi:16S rRNA (guanine966-N2)-methyltransferase
MLGDLSGANVLDLYAGSGALALEALSRGAARAVVVERDRSALACIRDNVALLEVTERVAIVPLALPRALGPALAHRPFDLVFCDPPWADLEQACATLVELAGSSGLGPEARVVLEHSAKDREPIVSGLRATERRAWGDTAVLFLTKGGDEE